MAVCNYSRLQKESYQYLQDQQDKFYAHKQVCEQLGIKKGVSENRASSMYQHDWATETWDR